MSASSAFTSSKIVPDVIDSPPSSTIEAPKLLDRIEKLNPVKLGFKMLIQQLLSYGEDRAQGVVALTSTVNKEGGKHPDNYDGPELVYREWHHWLVVNIPGSNISDGDVLSGYIGSGPPEGTGIHRYVYILFKQPGKLSFDEKKLDNKSVNGRAAFSTKKFAEKYNLGTPVAGNFYRAQFDDYVPKLYKSLGA